MTNPDTLHLALAICHGLSPPPNESNPVIIMAARMAYPSVETAWKSDVYVVLQILVSPNGDKGWPAVRSCPDITLTQFFTLYFRSLSPSLVLSSRQQKDKKNISGTVAHQGPKSRIYGLYMTRTAHNADARQINTRTKAVFSMQACYKPPRPFANGLESEPVCKRPEFPYGL